jgi:hypothetical protein
MNSEFGKIETCSPSEIPEQVYNCKFCGCTILPEYRGYCSVICANRDKWQPKRRGSIDYTIDLPGALISISDEEIAIHFLSKSPNFEILEKIYQKAKHHKTINNI